MSEKAAKTPSGESRKEIGTQKVNQKVIDEHIGKFTRNPNTTIGVHFVDTSFLKERKTIESGGPNGSGDSNYASFGDHGKISMEESLEQVPGIIIAAHSTEKSKDTKKTSKEQKESKEDEQDKEQK